MLLFFKLAFRNLIRNRVRTLLNLTMVIGAFTSIVIARGFAHYMLSAIETSLTEGRNGHMQLASPAVWDDNLPKKKAEAYIADADSISKKILALPGIQLVSGRATAYVLLFNGDKSVGAQAFGYDPDLEPKIQKNLSLIEGDFFSLKPQYEVLVGAGLQNNLQLKMGQTLSVVSQTLAGSMSTLDVEVKGVVKTGLSELDNSTIYLPLVAVQKILGTERVERLAILLEPGTHLEDSIARVQGAIQDHPELRLKSWKETAEIYRQLTDFYGVQNLFVEIILSCLVFFGILNTLGMSIYERIGEIGTLRALGDRSEAVLSQFLLEGLLLGALGVVLAVPIAAALAFGFSALELPVLLPGATKTMPVHIEPQVYDYWISCGIVIMTCVLAIIWPSLKAVRLSIVDALRANS